MTQRWLFGLRTVLLASALFSPSALLAQTSPGTTPDLAQAQALLKAAQAREALKLLAPFQDSHAGNPEFDYLHGLAALEAGDAAAATVALERVLIVDPNHLGARVDLARAYFALGDSARARGEFRIALAQNPPPAARATIESHLARISDGTAPGGAQVSGYMDVMAGRDSNVNSATGQGQIFIPVFGFSVQLAPASQRTPDNFASFGAGGEVSYALSNKTSLFAAGDARLRWNQHADSFSYSQYDMRAGVQQAFGSDKLLRASVSAQHYELDHNRYRGVGGLNVEWRGAIDAASQFSLLGAGNRVRYKDAAQTPNDADLMVLGASYTRLLNAAGRTSISASVIAGYERDVGQRIDGDRKLHGVRAGWQTGIGANIDLYSSAGYQSSRFETRNVIFNAQRKDNQTDATLGVLWRVDRVWSVRPQVTYMRNTSNIDIYAFDRYEASITLRRDFK